MKKKLEKATTVNLTSESHVNSQVTKGKVYKDKLDETYLRVNEVSFQQNFKALIGHFKSKDGSLVL
jgi:hypothetical protein